MTTYKINDDNVQKLSVSVPTTLYKFMDNYQTEHHCKRSEVIKRALCLLQEQQLKNEYAAASQEDTEVNQDFECTLSDGLDNNETW